MTPDHQGTLRGEMAVREVNLPAVPDIAPMPVDARDEEAFGGHMPSGENDLSLEVRGIAPIPVDHRYGSLMRVFTVWFSPNLIPATFFIGTLAGASFIGIGFLYGLAAILLGTVIGSIAPAVLCTWGPATGVAQLALARLPFGKSIVAPGLVMWGTTIAFDALNAIFGAEAAHLLFHVPFFIGLAVVLIVQGVIGIFGYEVVHLLQKWMSLALGVMFVVITVKIANVGNFSAPATVHGGSLVGGFILMAAISASIVVSWAPYASDYTRYLPAAAPARSVFWRAFAGLVLSCLWIELLGLAAASLPQAQTAAALRDIVGGGIIGVLVLITILLGSISSNAMNDYSGSLSLQAAGVRIPRPAVAGVVTVFAYAITMWLHQGSNLTAKFTNILLFVTYWVTGFVAIVVIDWYRRGGRARAHTFAQGMLLHWRALPLNLESVVALALGFAASMPFMDTAEYVGAASKSWLDGGDLAYVVNFVVTGVVYLILLRVKRLYQKRRSAASMSAERVPTPS